MFLKIVLALLIAVAFVAVLISIQPAQYKVTRSTTIAAPPSTVYNLIADFHHWNDWSPWAKLDPNMKQSFVGPDSGLGAAYAWQGNSQAGEGRMTISEVVPNERVVIFLEFLKPFASNSYVTFTLRPEGPNTSVLWSMDGESTFASKAIQLFSSMDKMVGPDFEKGLAQMKALAEQSVKPPAMAH